jgi:DNA polymerase-1
MFDNAALNVFTSEAYTLMHDGILTLSEMEQQGMRINRKYVRKASDKLTVQIESIEEEFKKTKFYRQWKHSSKKKVNVYSPQQLGTYLYKVKKIEPPKKTDSGLGATDEEALGQLGIPSLQLLLKAKKLKKMRDTYLASFLREQVNGFIHPLFALHLVRTYRGSAANPNVQNIPKRDEELMNIVRKAIYPRKGNMLLELDYSQLEVRVACAYHCDPRMMKEVKTGHDFHLDLAKQIFKIKKYNPKDKTHKTLRGAAKNGFVFPQFYGDWWRPCASNLASGWGELPKEGRWKKGMGIPFEDKNLADHLISKGFTNLDKFAEHIRAIEDDFWGNRYKTYAKWKESWYKEYLNKGFAHAKTGFTFQGNMSKNDVINYPVQGAAFHVLLWSLIEGVKAQKTEKWESRIVGQIHDAIIIDVYPPELDHVINVMKCIMCNDTRQRFPWINVPLEIEAELCGG